MKNIYDQWVKCVEQQDVKNVVALYAKEATLHPTLRSGIHSHQGVMTIEGYFKHFLAAPIKVLTNQYLEYDQLLIGQYTITRGQDCVQARFTFVFTKEGEVNKILHHHSSIAPV
ncbi:MAG: nuclear transport factor 2 family protein [Candidatus Comchoanobacterales bacterium]